MKTLALALLALCTLATTRPAGAQEMMPKPAPEMAKLDYFLGEWDGKMTMSMPGAPSEAIPTTLKSDRFADGMYLRSVYVLELPGMGKMEGTILLGWDAAAKSYRAWTFENTAPTPREEEGKFEGNKFVLISKPHSGMVTRATFTMKSAKECHFLIEMKEGDKWTPIGQANYTKKGA